MTSTLLNSDNSQSWTARLLTYGRMIKFSHTVFALPFALVAVILAGRQTSITPADIGWIILAMTAARSAAMGFNRVVDARLDKKNPRTRMREIPSGQISLAAACGFIAVSVGLFVFAAAMLGRQCLYLAVPILVILFVYSFTKRLTWLSHLFLGLAISLAPWGAWVALTKSFSGPIWLVSLALLTYIAGFDILYACQDIEFDKKEGLHSIPARFGLPRAMTISTLLHIITFAALTGIYFLFSMNAAYLIAVAIIGLLLVIEHRLVRPDNLSKIHVAFFHINSVISTILFLGVLMDEILRRAT